MQTTLLGDYYWLDCTFWLIHRIELGNNGGKESLIYYNINLSRCAKREAQAELIARRLLKYSRQTPNINTTDIIVLGDFNDFDNQCPGTDNNLSISQV